MHPDPGYGIRDEQPGSNFLEKRNHFFSVADPGCFSRIPDPDFYPSRIPDQKPQKREG
jgi:hypothetical protein